MLLTFLPSTPLLFCSPSKFLVEALDMWLVTTHFFPEAGNQTCLPYVFIITVFPEDKINVLVFKIEKNLSSVEGLQEKNFEKQKIITVQV